MTAGKVLKKNTGVGSMERRIEIELKEYCVDTPYDKQVFVNGEHCFNLLMTCECCPEQYDLLSVRDMSEVAYFRLRWSSFTVECPSSWGECVYRNDIGDGFDGCFENDKQRETEIKNALKEVIKWCIANNKL